MGDEYDVNGYTEEQLFGILDLNNPSDRELEAKILSMVRKYSNFGNTSGDKLSQFFIDIYNRFFETEESDEQEGFQTYTVDAAIVGNGNVYNSGVIGPTLPGNVTAESIFSKLKPGNGVIGETSLGNVVKPASDNLQLTRPLDYSKDKLNPLLKQTIKRIISIDSQYRNNQTNTPSTNFTFNLSEPLKDVVSLSLYSIQIPYTWYTVNSDFGGNFFYLKGNAPGIDTGLHDLQISIKSGNYTPVSLGTELNKSISVLARTYTDISFGTTEVIYNNRISDEKSGTGKCQIVIDITKIYNEGNYSLTFPNWSSPLDDILNNAKLNTIAGYLGFNNTEYYCGSIYSDFFKDTTDDVTSSKTSFNIVPYIGNDYLHATKTYDAITINLEVSLNSNKSTSDLVSALNQVLQSKISIFDNRFTSCTIIDVSNPLQYGNDNSYVKLSCKLNDLYAPVVPNLKLAAVFPYDASGSLFCGTGSFFKFSESIKNPITNDIICEFNEIISESPILQSNYDASNTQIMFVCNIIGYNNDYNNLTIDIQSVTYTLNSFISTTTTAINSAVSSSSRLTKSNISFYYDASSYLNINSLINNTYTNSDYKIRASSGTISSMFNISTSYTGIPIDASYNNRNFSFRSISFTSLDKIYIQPDSSGNKNANIFEILFNSNGRTFSNGADLANYLSGKIQNYIDPITNLNPFNRSNVVYTVSNGFVLNLSISLNISQISYKLKLLDGNSLDVSNNIWSKLRFDSSYNLVDYSNNNIVRNNSTIKNNEITIVDGSNDTFYLTPSNSVDVFNTSGNTYRIAIKIPDTSTTKIGTKYSIYDLLNIINTQLATNSNAIANGTVFSLFPKENGKTHIKARFNINQRFTTKDYKLVFYDPYSFAKCIPNNSNAASNGSIQNATWDTTLGWILGFRDKISYQLSDYIGINATSGNTVPSIYYSTEIPNACVLEGDTNVSTNLYNYFLIMLDDYVQNHLNDGLVTITNQETIVDPGPHINICDPVTKQNIAVPADYGSPGVTYTAQQLYAFNQQVQSQIVKTKSYSNGPFVQDIFGIIPVKTSGMAIGSVYVEFGGSLQNQQRLYFGPVNIHRMTIKLLNDRGNLVDLNKANWSFSFICEQLYKSGIS